MDETNRIVHCNNASHPLLVLLLSDGSSDHNTGGKVAPFSI